MSSAVYTRQEKEYQQVDTANKQVETANKQVETADKQVETANKQAETTDKQVETAYKKVETTDKQVETTDKEMVGKLTPVLLALVAVSVISAASYRRVCYHTNWSQYRTGPAKFYPENIDPRLCTHVIYAFAKLTNNKLTPFEWNDESTPWMKGMYERFNKLKQQNPALKTSLAVGGWNMGSAPFTQMVATDATRRAFATDAVKFLRKHNFDGLDLDWEYPGNRGSPASDKDKYTELVKVLNSEFKKEAQTSGKDQLILSAAIPAGKSNIDPGYNVPEISKYVDMLNLMTYDLHGGSWEDETGHNAPLHQSPKDKGNNTMLNVEWAAKYWVSKGAPKAKLNIGMPLYGRSFTLASPSNNGLYAPDRGNGGQAGKYTRESGFLAYYEICEMLKTGGTRHYLPDAMVPYLVKGDQWVGYDDPDSLKKKVDFVKQGGYGGAMVWALDLDDFSGSCGQGKYPLLKAINDELQSSSVPVAQTTKGAAPTNKQTTPGSGSGPLVQSTTSAPSPACVNTGGGNSSGKRSVCYYANWAQYRSAPAKFLPENIDPTLCTHVIYSFAKLVNNHLAPFETNDESKGGTKGMYERVLDMKKQNPSLKVSLAVGGWNMGSAPFSRMVSTDATRRDFATNAVKFLRDHGFDGLDIDWEYPANRGSPAGDKAKFVELMKVLDAEFKKEAQSSGKDKLLLSLAVPTGKSNIDSGYDVPQASKYVDMFNLMAYDLHGASWESFTGHNAPLYQSAGDSGNINVAWAANYWAQKGAPKSKINIGMPLYGRTYNLANPGNNGVHAPDSGGGGPAGQYTKEAGTLAYFELCKMVKNGATRHFDNQAKVPYLVSGNEWISYDDAESLKAKVDFINKQGFGGAMVWSLDLDDFTGSVCGEGKYPLLRAINSGLGNTGAGSGSGTGCVTQATQKPTSGSSTTAKTTSAGQQTTKSTPASWTTAKPQVTTTQPQSTTHHIGLTQRFNCNGKASGFYADPSSCESYFICAGSQSFEVMCAKGLKFNPKTKYCDWSNQVKCGSGSSTTSQSQSQTTTQMKQTTPPAPGMSTKSTPQSSTTTTSTTTTTTTTMPKTTTTMPSSGGKKPCDGMNEGIERDPNDCGMFYVCDQGHGVHERCPPGTAFSTAIKNCDYPAHVPGCEQYTG
ncbi:hypothetical protein FSP39_002736 [Pinctada imbricata]|uniref:Chitinase n=1 Tax=Pinctada imbricata TaxID=66713 RepID=A0AA88Y4I6_PINIB|nr:hypothetical protein FSP39_002736 [Pinctada imbricata]